MKCNKKSQDPFQFQNNCEVVTALLFKEDDKLYLANYDLIKGVLNTTNANAVKCTTNCPSNPVDTFKFVDKTANARCAGCGFSYAKTFSIEYSVVNADESELRKHLFWKLPAGQKFGLAKLAANGSPIIANESNVYNQKLWGLWKSLKQQMEVIFIR